MQNIQELKENYEKNTLKTIVLSKKNYDKLKQLGFTGESFNTVVGRLLEKVEEDIYMSTKLETETFAGKSIQAWRDQATIAGLVLREPSDKTDSGDYPDKIYSTLRRFRRNIAITKDHKKIITNISRQLVTQRDDKGKTTKKEYLTYSGYYSGTTHKGEKYDANFEIGKYQRPEIVHNGNMTYDPRTGDPIGNEKILGSAQTIYEIECPKTKEARKKLVDSILGEDNHTNKPHTIKTCIRL